MKFSRPSAWGLAVLALVIANAGPVRAQAVYGSIAGTVADSTGASVPGATVTITSPERKTSDTVVTNASGNYLQGPVAARPLRGEGRADGLQGRAGLEGRRERRHPDPASTSASRLGDITETITVEATAASS